MLAFLQLLRLPTLFTAMADIFAGYVLAHGSLSPIETFGWLLLASGSLYLSGMVWNDVFDVAQDQRERPQRPIPSGQISRSLAVATAVGLMALGLVAAGQASASSIQVAAAIAVMVLVYDRFAKRTRLGPLAMGSCRFLNILLGASSVGWPALSESKFLLMAGAIGVYIVGVTWFARHEASTSARADLISAMVIINLGMAIEAILFTWLGESQQRVMIALLLLGMIAVSVNRVVWGAIQSGEQRAIQRTIGHLLLSLIMLDAAAVYWQLGQTPIAFGVAALVIPAILLKRWIPMT